MLLLVGAGSLEQVLGIEEGGGLADAVVVHIEDGRVLGRCIEVSSSNPCISKIAYLELTYARSLANETGVQAHGSLP